MKNELVEFLRLHSCCAGLSLSELESIAELASFRTYASGETVIEAGDSFYSLSLVISGLFEVRASTNLATPIIYLGPRDEIGFLHIMHDSASPVTIRATEPSRVIEIDQDVAKTVIAENRVLARNLYALSNSHLAKAVSKERRSHLPKHIAFVHPGSQTIQHSQQIQSRLHSLGESIAHITNHHRPHVSGESGFETIQIEEFDSETESKLRATMAERSDVDRILIDVYFDSSERMAKMIEKLFSIPERVYLFVKPDDVSLLSQVVAAVEAEPGWKKKINVVWILDEGNRVAPIFPELQTLCKRVFKIKHSNTERSGIQFQSSIGVERIVHDLRGVKIGLALGGGAARGMCHLGVLRAFDEAGIVIDAISGTSVGAMMGLAYCSGYSPDEAVEMFTSALTPRGIFHLLGDKFYMLFKYQTRAWEDMLRNHFFDWQLEQLLVPLMTVSADLVSAEQCTRTRGDAVIAILESINLGGLSQPILRDGQALVDGGYLNNVPADVLVRNGADFVISVDVTQSIRRKIGSNTPDTPTSEMKPIRSSRVFARIREIAQRNVSLLGAAFSDFAIYPDVSHVDYADFKSTPEIANIGYETAVSLLPDLKKKLNQIDSKLFPL